METNKPSIRRDDFNNIIRDRYFISLELRTKIEKEILFRIMYIDTKGISSYTSNIPEIIIKPTPETVFLLTYVNIVNAIIKKDSNLSESIRQNILNGLAAVDEIDYPNEYTMWHSTWYKHSYLFLQPFYSYDGSLLRLSYMINELVEEKILNPNFIVLDEEIRNYPIMLADDK